MAFSYSMFLDSIYLCDFLRLTWQKKFWDLFMLFKSRKSHRTSQGRGWGQLWGGGSTKCQIENFCFIGQDQKRLNGLRSSFNTKNHSCPNKYSNTNTNTHTHTHIQQGGQPGPCCCWPLPLPFDLTTVGQPLRRLLLSGCRRLLGWTVVGRFRKGGGRKSQVQKIFRYFNKKQFIKMIYRKKRCYLRWDAYTQFFVGNVV